MHKRRGSRNKQPKPSFLVLPRGAARMPHSIPAESLNEEGREKSQWRGKTLRCKNKGIRGQRQFLLRNKINKALAEPFYCAATMTGCPRVLCTPGSKLM